MTTLSLGVYDVPYADADNSAPASSKPRKGRAPKRLRRTKTTSTGDVAEILETKYGIMQAFFDYYQEKITAKLESDIAAQIENLFLGAPPAPNPFAGLESFVKSCFSDFLSLRQVEMVGLKGVPTQAALSGVNHRMKHPYAKRGPRPSFIDTGLYENSFVAEVKA